MIKNAEIMRKKAANNSESTKEIFNQWKAQCVCKSKTECRHAFL